MRLSTKLVLVIALVVVGVLAALPFRRSKPVAEPTGPSAISSIERRLSNDNARTASGQFQSVPSKKSQPRRVPTAATGFVPDAVAQAPEMPERYHHTFSPVGALLHPREEPARQNPLRDDESSAPRLRPREIDDAQENLITHKIVDGDTLVSLAERYLANGQRYREIFELNRDVLKNPDLLPIGRVIKIPPRNTLESAPMAPIPRGAFRREAT
jgi:nucleoid-associated protein YgaU